MVDICIYSKVDIYVNGKKEEDWVWKDKQMNQIVARAYSQWLSCCSRKAKKVVVVIPFPSDSWASLTHTAYAFAFHILFLSYLSLFFSCHFHIRVQLQVDAHPLFTKLPPPPPPTDLFQHSFRFQSCMYLVSIAFLFLYIPVCSCESLFETTILCFLSRFPAFLFTFGMLLHCSVRWTRRNWRHRWFACLNIGRWCSHLLGGWSLLTLQWTMPLDWSGVVEDGGSVAMLFQLVSYSRLKRRRAFALRFTVLIFEISLNSVYEEC